MSVEIDDFDRMMRRLEASLHGSWEACIYGAIEQLEEVCESPIEVMLGSALLLGGMLADGPGKAGVPFIQLQKADALDRSSCVVAVVPQYLWKNYRIDFALFADRVSQPVFIECDGHDFHERTKEQASRDRTKDRAIQEAGLTVLRFTGSEIYRDPDGCAAQVLNVLANRVEPRTA